MSNSSSSSLAERIVTSVTSTFAQFPSNGKPKDENEFTVLAALVGVSNNDQMMVLSIGTGTKCAGKAREDKEGYILCDSHAEVIAIRGFRRWLTKCMMALHKDPTLAEEPLFPLEYLDNKFCMKLSWSFYLYISDSPCGDASIYPRQHNTQSGFTGAKIVRPFSSTGETSAATAATATATATADDSHITGSIGMGAATGGCCLWEREVDQDVGVLRVKSGRSDIPERQRTTSMSCSDKICRWATLGLEGRRLSFIQTY